MGRPVIKMKSKNKKKILFVTGTRADYGKLKPLMKTIEKEVFFDLHIFVGGMHLLEIFGNTYLEVKKGGYKNIYVAHGLVHSDKMSINLANTISHLTGYVNGMEPDMIVVHGDRVEALAGAVVGALNNIIVAHIEGGEVSGTIDESIRHAISKFSHLHFVCNKEAKKRITQLGERANNIFLIGSPDIDIMLNGNLPSLEEVKKYYEINFEDYGILMYHPITTEYEKMRKNTKTIVDAVLKSGKNYVVIYPNNDLGSEIILNEYSRFKNKKNFAIFPSMRFEYFLTLLKNAEFMVGNSSAGIREASVYGIPAIDIGTRQAGRYNLNILKNIQHVKENTKEILKAIDGVHKRRIVRKHFGRGDSTEKFMKIISKKSVWDKKLQKKFVDFVENVN